MIKYLLDTNICIYIIKRKPIKVIQKLQTMKVNDIGISSITLSELEYGVSKSSQPERNKLALAEFLGPIEILAYDDLCAAKYGHIRSYLEKQGTPIGSLDMLIGSHALALGCTLVTNNIKEFNRIGELVIENWV